MSAPDTSGFQPIPNPYIVGNPIKDRALFFGREDDFDYVKKKVVGGTKGGLLVLCGARRSGKTSILFQIKDGRLGAGIVPVLIDMQAMTVQGDAEFLALLAREVLSALGGGDEGVAPEIARLGAENPYAVFQDMIAAFHRALGERKLILMFDEYELFETHIDQGRITPDILNLLASWIERQDGIFILFTGSDKLEARRSRHWERFLGKALHRRISFLSEADTLRLIREPVAAWVRYDAGIPESIHRLTAGQPFYTQVFCQSLVDRLNEDRRREVHEQDVAAVVDEIVDNPLPQMIFAWSSLTAMEKLSLSIIAACAEGPAQAVTPARMQAFIRDERLGLRLDVNKLQEGLERLFHQDLLAKHPHDEGYSFRMDLWRRWIARMHSVWQAIDEVSAAGFSSGEGVALGRRMPRRSYALAAAGVVVVGSLIVLGAAMRRHPEAPAGPPAGTAPAPRDSTTLSIFTTPPGAGVFLGAQWVGKSPVEKLRVPAALAPLRVDLPGYEEFRDTLELRAETPLERVIALAPRRGRLRVTSEPPGARILLAGRDTGVATPALIPDLPIRERQNVRLTLAGYSDGAYPALEIHEDSTFALHHVFARVTHPLTLTSQPSGARLHLDGQFLGETPKPLPAVGAGSHQIEVELDGYRRVRETIDVPAARDALDFVLVPLPPGVLIVRIEPYADLWVDGALLREGAVYFALELSAGDHVVSLRHPHYGAVERPVTVASGDTVTVQQRFGEQGEGR